MGSAPVVRSICRCRARIAAKTTTTTTTVHTTMMSKVCTAAVRSDLFACGAQPRECAVVRRHFLRVALRLGGAELFPRPGHVDVLGHLGLLGEDRDAVAVHRQEAAVDRHAQFLAA